MSIDGGGSDAGLGRTAPTRIARAVGLIALASVGCSPRGAASPPAPSTVPVTFFAIADPQINIPRWGAAGTEATIEMMNDLPGATFPFGGTIREPAGVVVAGDLVDDLENEANWVRYEALFDPAGQGRLRFPVFAGQGNHDVDVREQPFGVFNPTQMEFIARNRRRPGDLVFGPHGYHYSWVWGGVRLVQLNLFPGTTHRPVYDAPAPGNDPKGSLAFLQHVLEDRVGDSGQPIILIWHYGLRGWGLERWWLEEDLDRLARVLEGHNVLLILHGHEHRYERYRWRGYDVIMAPSPQYDRDPEQPQTASRPKGFLVFRITDDQLQMGYRTPDGWEATWSKPIGRPEPGRPGPVLPPVRLPGVPRVRLPGERAIPARLPNGTAAPRIEAVPAPRPALRSGSGEPPVPVLGVQVEVLVADRVLPDEVLVQLQPQARPVR